MSSARGTVKLSLEPLAPAREETHPDTGAVFSIAALSGERDHEITRECTDMYNVTDVKLLSHAIVGECLKGWKYVGNAKGEEMPCTPENVKRFVDVHLVGIVPWLVRRARSIEHYRIAEVDAAKKD